MSARESECVACACASREFVWVDNRVETRVVRSKSEQILIVLQLQLRTERVARGDDEHGRFRESDARAEHALCGWVTDRKQQPNEDEI